jgi:PAS domain S-box-containing protein
VNRKRQSGASSSHDASKASRLTRLRTVQTQLAESDPRRLVEQLQSYQIELEVQNEELTDARRLLEAAHEHYFELYDLAPIAYCTVDAGGVITDINQTGAELLGYPKSYLVGLPLIVAATIENKQGFWDLLAASCKRADLAKIELAVKTRTKRLIVELSSRPTGRADGQCRVVLTDITQRKQLEEELRQARNEAEAARSRASLLADVSAQLTASLPDLDLDETARLLVPAIAEWCIIEVDEEAGAVEAVAVAHADLGLCDALRERARQHPSRLDDIGSTARLRALGAHSFIVAPIMGRDRVRGALTLSARTGFYGDADRSMVEEIGRRIGSTLHHAQLHRHLTQAARSRDELLRLASHDLRNCLASAELHIDLLSRQPGEQVRTSAAGLAKANALMTRLVGDLVDLAAAEPFASALLSRSVDARVLVRAAVSAVLPAIAAKGLRISVELPNHPLPVLCDDDRIQQVLLNLVGNAIKFTDANGTIGVGVERVADEIVFTVEDSGRGISPGDAPHVFEQHWRSSRAAGGGYGLGLFIARRIVEAHDGRIWVDSPSVGGARFSFSLRGEPIARSS